MEGFQNIPETNAIALVSQFGVRMQTLLVFSCTYKSWGKMMPQKTKKKSLT